MQFRRKTSETVTLVSCIINFLRNLANFRNSKSFGFCVSLKQFCLLNKFRNFKHRPRIGVLKTCTPITIGPRDTWRFKISRNKPEIKTRFLNYGVHVHHEFRCSLIDMTGRLAWEKNGGTEREEKRRKGRKRRRGRRKRNESRGRRRNAQGNFLLYCLINGGR